MAAGLVSCFSKDKDKETKKENTAGADSAGSNIVQLSAAQIKNAGIETGKPEMKDLPVLLKVNGTVDVPPQNMATVSFPSGGYLKSTTLLPGMQVRKGQHIAIMEDPAFIQLQQDYLTGETKLQYLHKEYERQHLLNESKAVSDKIYEQAQSEYRTASIMVSALKQKLLLLGINPEKLNENTISRTVPILAPISGYVSSVKVNIGKYVSPSDVLFEIVDNSDLHLALIVFEKDLYALRTGQQVLTSPAGDSSKSYPAHIVLVGKLVDSNRSALVHCHFQAPEPSLLPGTFMNAVIRTSQQSGIAVPDDAVVQSGSVHYIFVQQQPGRFLLTPVTPGESNNGFTILQNEDQRLLQSVIIRKNAYAALMRLKNTGEDE